jgi:hypothetical protein
LRRFNFLVGGGKVVLTHIWPPTHEFQHPYPLVEYPSGMTKAPPLPLECTVMVTLDATCSIPGCAWRATLCGAYDRMPSVKTVYAEHLLLIHPGFVPSVRPGHTQPVPMTPERIEVAKAELAALCE